MNTNKIRDTTNFFTPTRFKLILFAIILVIFPWQLFFKQIDWIFFVFLPMNVFISYFDACLFVHLVKLAREYKKKKKNKVFV